jgi:cell wall assembly regulator SMI1
LRSCVSRKQIETLANIQRLGSDSWFEEHLSDRTEFISSPHAPCDDIRRMNYGVSPLSLTAVSSFN